LTSGGWIMGLPRMRFGTWLSRLHAAQGRRAHEETHKVAAP
jgi:hypothetical protein